MTNLKDVPEAVRAYRKEKAYLAEVCAAGTLEDLADAAIAELEAENERLKCCGNCSNETWATDSEEPCTLCHPTGHGGPPSRWTPRGGE